MHTLYYKQNSAKMKTVNYAVYFIHINKDQRVSLYSNYCTSMKTITKFNSVQDMDDCSPKQISPAVFYDQQ